MFESLNHLILFSPVLPELLLAVGVLVLIMIGAYGGDERYAVITSMSVSFLLVAIGALIFWVRDGSVFSEALVLGDFERFMKVLTLIGAFAALVLSWTYNREENFQRFEFPILILLGHPWHVIDDFCK